MKDLCCLKCFKSLKHKTVNQSRENSDENYVEDSEAIFNQTTEKGAAEFLRTRRTSDINPFKLIILGTFESGNNRKVCLD